MKLRQLLQRPTSLSAFTMVELLIVIAIIALLAVAVLATLNPIEQINKARDTSTRTDAAELIKASERFFAVHEMFPWDFDNGDNWTDPTDADGDPDDAFSGDGTEGWVSTLESTQELKPSLITRIEEVGADYLVYKAADEDTVFVCFEPRSDQFRLEAAERCNNDIPDGDTGDTDTAAGVACPDGATTTVADNPWLCVP